jgi:hyperosmotically inducible protein
MEGKTMRSIRYAAPLATSVLIFFSGIQSLALAGAPESEVLASTGTAIDDTVITTKIKAAYVKDPLVSTLDIHVDTYRGVVRLNGAANSEAEKERAATIARGMDGVVEVRNDIQVKPARQDP